MYGLFSRKKKQIRLSPLSGGSGPPNGGQDEVGGGEPSGEPPPTSSRPPFGGHDLQTMEIIRSVSSFEKNPYNVSSNLSLSRAHFMFICFGRSWRSWRSFKCTDYAYITYIKSGKSHHLVNGSIAHLQSINLRSERDGFESREEQIRISPPVCTKLLILFLLIEDEDCF